MKNKILSVITTVILTSFSVFSQTYDSKPGESFHPLLPGQKNYYQTDLRVYSMYFDSTETEFQGKKYLKQTYEDGASKSITYYRVENGNVLYIQPNQKIEALEIPSNPIQKMTWYNSDSTWMYTIIDTAETLKTPIGKFKDCLVIQSENLDRKAAPHHYRLYLQYFQRGRGYVGTKIGGILYSYPKIK